MLAICIELKHMCQTNSVGVSNAIDHSTSLAHIALIRNHMDKR